jgi:hypothetical protein
MRIRAVRRRREKVFSTDAWFRAGAAHVGIRNDIKWREAWVMGLKRFRRAFRSILDWFDQSRIVADNVESDVAVANTDPTLVRHGGSAVLGRVNGNHAKRLGTENLQETDPELVADSVVDQRAYVLANDPGDLGADEGGGVHPASDAGFFRKHAMSEARKHIDACFTGMSGALNVDLGPISTGSDNRRSVAKISLVGAADVFHRIDVTLLLLGVRR